MSTSHYPILYSFRRCPYAIRSRMALAVASIKCELREVVLKDKPLEMLKISDKGTVPVLQLADGRVLDESLDIMHWALQQSDPEQWLGRDEEKTNALISSNDREFKHKLDRYKYFTRYPEHTQQYYREQAEDFLTELEEYLQSHKGLGLVEDKVSLADMAIFPFVRQFSRVDYAWFSQSRYVALINWLLKIETSEQFKAVMKKYKAWTGKSAIQLFPK